jgi:hypothetical protein
MGERETELHGRGAGASGRSLRDEPSGAGRVGAALARRAGGPADHASGPASTRHAAGRSGRRTQPRGVGPPVFRCFVR